MESHGFLRVQSQALRGRRPPGLPIAGSATVIGLPRRRRDNNCDRIYTGRVLALHLGDYEAVAWLDNNRRLQCTECTVHFSLPEVSD